MISIFIFLGLSEAIKLAIAPPRDNYKQAVMLIKAAGIKKDDKILINSIPWAASTVGLLYLEEVFGRRDYKTLWASEVGKESVCRTLINLNEQSKVFLIEDSRRKNDMVVRDIYRIKIGTQVPVSGNQLWVYKFNRGVLNSLTGSLDCK